MATSYRKKLIEVAIPLDDINRESAREKSIRHGHPSTLHLWWARRPLASCRAVLFTSLIDDPGEEGVPQELLDGIDALAKPELPAEEWDALDLTGQRRKRLFNFIGELVKWESTTNETVLEQARALIRAATGGTPPPILDPFCGGGSIPLEAQRLGLVTYASDLNPVAVLITKALIEIPPHFAGRPPVNPDVRAGGTGSTAAWQRAEGLAADVRWYGRWMREQASQRIGHLYPKGSNGETVIAWLWARTVRCPNPACGAQMPLVSSFWLSKKKGREAWVEPIVEKKTVRFEVRTSGSRDTTKLDTGTKTARGAKFFCLVCGSAAEDQHIKDEGMAGRMGRMGLAIVAEGNRQRLYLSADSFSISDPAPPELGGLAGELADDPRNIWCKQYGLRTYADLFTSRQLVALTTFSDLIGEVHELAKRHAVAADFVADGIGIAAGGSGAEAYADAVVTYLAFAIDRSADYWSSLCGWHNSKDIIRNTFARQALPMVWDFAEANPFSESIGNWESLVNGTARAMVGAPAVGSAQVEQLDATAAISGVPGIVVATDPPYYDNISYADLSDFFHVWLRRSLGRIYPKLFATVLTPKTQELVATPYRFKGGRTEAESHFESGFDRAFALIRERTTPDVPVTLYYAFKQAESGRGGVASTGWEKMLSGLVSGGFQVTGTWPMRTELSNRTIGSGTNALASSIVLTCRPRLEDAPIATLREFTAALQTELPKALKKMIGERLDGDASSKSKPVSAHIAPVDLSQAAIGPGMAVFSRYSKVVEPNGEPMRVRRALELINEAIERFFAEREGGFDADTQFCIRWFEQSGFAEGKFGDADVLARAKNVVIDALARDEVLSSERGRVRLYGPSEYVGYWATYNPATDRHTSAWEACHYLAAALMDPDGGERASARLARQLGGLAHDAIELAYRLYAICERKGWSQEGQSYNLLADAWPAIQAAMTSLDEGGIEQQARLV